MFFLFFSRLFEYINIYKYNIMNKSGNVYCVTNPLMLNILKCGGTQKDPNNRCKQLSNTSLPVNCKLEYFIQVSDWREAEKYIHNKLIEKGYIRYDKKEWFKCTPEEVKYIYDECKLLFPIQKIKKLQNNIKRNVRNIYTNLFTCIKCNYNTNRQYDWDKHLLTTKHIKNTKEIYVCNICNKNFNTKSAQYKHNKICLNKEKLNNNDNKFLDNNLESIPKNELIKHILKMNQELTITKNELEKEKLKNKYDKKEISRDKKEITRLNTLLTTSTKTTNKALDITDKTISAIKYANKHFTNAPELIPINNFNMLNYDLTDDDDKKLLIETLLYHYRKNSVHKLFGDHIVSIYKKDNIDEQSMYTTDTSRLNYIIRISKDEKPVKWYTDKNGVIISDVIIEKLINHYVELLKWYQ